MPIEIEQTQLLEPPKAVEPEIENDNQPEPVSQDQPPDNQFNQDLDNEIQVKLQPILLDSAINALGHTLAKITSIDDMDFTEDEHKALVEAWTPLLPSVSPMTNAVLVTVIILSGKGLLYVAHRKKLNPKNMLTEAKEVTKINEAINN